MWFAFLFFVQSAVTRNYSEKSINSILDYISTSKQMDLLQNFYETTLEALKGSPMFLRITLSSEHMLQYSEGVMYSETSTTSSLRLLLS